MAKKKKSEDEADVTETSSETPVEAPKKKPVNDNFTQLAAAFQKKWPGQSAVASDLSLKGIPRISTGCIAIDVATDGGVPRGRITRFWGAPKSAKTGSAFNVVAEWQKHCSVCFERKACGCKDRAPAGAVWIDAEGRSSDNMPWMLAHGIDLDRCIVLKPDCGEKVVDATDAALRMGCGLVVVDSIANIVASAELNKPTEDGGVIGRNAQLINSALRKWQASINAAGVDTRKAPTILLLNQIRNKTDGYGNPDVMPGGKGQDYATSLDIRFTKRAFHYLVNEGTEEDPKYVDKQAGGGQAGYKPKQNESPAYIEIEFAVTSGNVGRQNQFGAFNYWLRAIDGHHPGDPDNEEYLFNFSKAQGWLEKTSGGYKLRTLEGRTQDNIWEQLRKDKELQLQLWDEVIELKSKQQ